MFGAKRNKLQQANLEIEREKLETSKKQLEVERKTLEAERKSLEAEKRLFEEEKKLEAERKLMEEEVKKNSEEKDEETTRAEQRAPILKKVRRSLLWAGLGVVASILPFLMGMLYDWLSGYTISSKALEYISDLLLVVTAVSASVCNISIDSKDTVKRVFFIFVSAVLLAFGFGAYSFLYGKSSGIGLGRIKIIAWISAGALLLNAAIGIVIECNND